MGPTEVPANSRRFTLAHTVATKTTWIADTWQTCAQFGEIESLAVSPDNRGQRIGSRLLCTLHREMEVLGVQDLNLGVLPGNADALGFYERSGYQPTWAYLSHFDNRHAHYPGAGGA